MVEYTSRHCSHGNGLRACSSWRGAVGAVGTGDTRGVVPRRGDARTRTSASRSTSSLSCSRASKNPPVRDAMPKRESRHRHTRVPAPNRGCHRSVIAQRLDCIGRRLPSTIRAQLIDWLSTSVANECCDSNLLRVHPAHLARVVGRCANMDQPADGPMGAVAPSAGTHCCCAAAWPRQRHITRARRAAMDDAITAGAAAGFASKVGLAPFISPPLSCKLR